METGRGQSGVKGCVLLFLFPCIVRKGAVFLPPPQHPSFVSLSVLERKYTRYFSYCCGQISDKKQLQGGYLGSRVKDMKSITVEKEPQQKCDETGHFMSMVWKPTIDRKWGGARWS